MSKSLREREMDRRFSLMLAQKNKYRRKSAALDLSKLDEAREENLYNIIYDQK